MFPPSRALLVASLLLLGWLPGQGLQAKSLVVSSSQSTTVVNGEGAKNERTSTTTSRFVNGKPTGLPSTSLGNSGSFVIGPSSRIETDFTGSLGGGGGGGGGSRGGGGGGGGGGRGGSGSGSSSTVTSSSSSSASASASSSTKTRSSDGDSKEGPVVAIATSRSEDGATTSSKAEAHGSKGGSATAVASAVGKGDVEVEEEAIAVSEEGSDVVVVSFREKVEKGAKSKKQLRKELVKELEELLPGEDFSSAMGKGLEDEELREYYISAAEEMLEELKCKAFKLLFDGKTLPIARAKGAGKKVNNCIFQACPEACCSDAGTDSCSCRRGVCEWQRPKSFKSKGKPTFFRCRRCKKTDDSCMCT